MTIESLIPVQNTVAVRDLVQEPKRQFSIPFNQRPWVWKDRNLSELWADIQKTVDRFFEQKTLNGRLKERKHPDGNPHYFGAFVFYEREADLYEVVDGQQRLTSICMLAAVLRELAQDVSNRSKGNLGLRNEADGLVTSLTAWVQSNPAAGAARLRLDSQYDELFRSYVVEPRSEEDRASAYELLSTAARSQKGNAHIKRGFDALRKLVLADLAVHSDTQLVAYIRALESVFGDAFFATRVVVSDEPFALSVFSALNSRGVALNAADQIKNELFERSEPKHHRQIKDDWDAIMASVPGGDIEHFLRQRHLAFVNSDCPKSQLYFNVRERELEESEPQAVIARWRKDAELLSILTTEKGHGKIKGKLARQLKTLHRQLGITYSWPLLLSAGHRFFPGDTETFGKLARLTLAFCFRVLTIGKRDVAELERTLAQAAIELTNGKSPQSIARLLREANSDAEFESDFAEVTLRRASTQFYALFEIEAWRSRQAGLSLQPFPHSPSQNVEHILPRRLPNNATRLGEWSFWRSSANPTLKTEAHYEYVNRLGNLLILEGEINGQVGNYDFEAKRTGAYPGAAAKFKGAPRKSFADSKLRLVKDVCDPTTYSKWTRKEIERRQRSLAQDAVKAWTLRFE